MQIFRKIIQQNILIILMPSAPSVHPIRDKARCSRVITHYVDKMKKTEMEK